MDAGFTQPALIIVIRQSKNTVCLKGEQRASGELLDATPLARGAMIRYANHYF